jgi:hypothetical protein
VHSSLLLDTCRSIAQTHNCKAVDVIAAILHFVVKELAVRLPTFREADVMGLAQVLGFMVYGLELGSPTSARLTSWVSRR